MAMKGTVEEWATESLNPHDLAYPLRTRGLRYVHHGKSRFRR